jgi:GNAT superfamily N-acetyltransferase
MPSTPELDNPTQVATSADYPEIARLMNSGYRGESSRAGWTTEADYFDGERINPDSLAQQLSETPGRLMLTLRDDTGLLGCVYLELACGADQRGCYLGMLTVRPATQARGIGRKLLLSAENYARTKGALRMTLGVLNPREELMAWYERRGYKRTGETAPFPYTTQAAKEKPKRDDLHFIFFEKALSF